MTQQSPTQHEGRLSALGRKIKSAMDDAARGPLIVARDVVAIVESWDQFKSEAGGLSASQWVESVTRPGRDAAWFKRRATAVARIGEHARRTWDHEALVWAVDAFVDDVSLRRLDKQVRAESDALGGVVLGKNSVQRIARELGLMRPRESKKVCARCSDLEKLLEANGIAAPK